MKSNTSKGLVAAALLGLSATVTLGHFASAAPGARGDRGAQRGSGRLAQELNLTEDQKAQLKPILQNAASQIKALRADTSLSAEEKRARFQTIRQEVQSQTAAILTPEQQAKLAELREQRKAQRGQGRQNRRGRADSSS